MAQAEKEQDQPRKNPIIWVSLIVIGVIIFIFTASDRGGVDREELLSKHKTEVVEPPPEVEGQLDRDEFAQPGMRARKLIQQIREQGKPYEFDELMARASSFAIEGSLADAHLIFFFAAREGNVEAMMRMAEMMDPTLFRPENNLLDKANAVQAYKWYRKALDSGFEPAAERLENLRYWAETEADYGNADARQLLLNFN